MDDENQPVGVEDFLVPAEDESGEQNEVAAGDEVDLLPASDEPAEDEAVPDEPEESDEADADEDEAPEPLPMPASWGKDDAEAWGKLDPAAQEVIARREGERDKYIRDVGRKAAETRHTVENEAREVIAQQAEQHAAMLQAYAQQFMPAAPDQRLLYTGNPDDVLSYQRQDAAYRAATAQQHQLQQEVARAQQQASEARSQAEQQEIAADAQRLHEQLPEWFDPSAGPKLQQELQSIGAELGYPAELMAQAGSTDILALRKAAEWKAKADKLDSLNAKKMQAVRAAKGLPKMARPGVTQGKGAQAADAAARREAAMNSFAETRSGDAAAALLLTRKR
jgi:hypothetical protein